jgi:hypothetical protein
MAGIIVTEQNNLLKVNREFKENVGLYLINYKYFIIISALWHTQPLIQ